MHVFVMFCNPKAPEFQAMVPELNDLYDKYTRFDNQEFN